MIGRVVLVRLTSLKNFSKVHIFWGLTSSRPAKIGVRCFLIPGRGNVWKKSKEQIWDEVEWQFCEIVSHPVREDKSGAVPGSTGSARSQQFAPRRSPRSPEKTTLKSFNTCQTEAVFLKLCIIPPFSWWCSTSSPCYGDHQTVGKEDCQWPRGRESPDWENIKDLHQRRCWHKLLSLIRCKISADDDQLFWLSDKLHLMNCKHNTPMLHRSTVAPNVLPTGFLRTARSYISGRIQVTALL